MRSQRCGTAGGPHLKGCLCPPELALQIELPLALPARIPLQPLLYIMREDPGVQQLTH